MGVHNGGIRRNGLCERGKVGLCSLVIATEKNIAFSVVDHGQGISDEDKHYIFDRFYSGDKSHANKSNFGLGLSIAKELTQMLNGTIIINDTAGGGATFTVKFPLK